MIEVNLLGGKKPFALPKIGPIDLNHINLKLVVAAMLINSFIIPMFEPDWDSETVDVTKEIAKMEAKTRKLKMIMKQSKSLQNEISEYEKLEKSLTGKLEIVRKVLSVKKNPYQVLLFVAQNTPEDLWLNKLAIENDKIVIDGYSKSYKSIGRFIDILKGSVFFDSSLKLTSSETVSLEEGKGRAEQFNLDAKVVRYD